MHAQRGAARAVAQALQAAVGRLQFQRAVAQAAAGGLAAGAVVAWFTSFGAARTPKALEAEGFIG